MPSSTVSEKLLLSIREAAGVLSICEKSLWSMTKPRGSIPCVRVGSRVLYSVDALRRFIAESEQTGIAAEDNSP